jgi:uncharacterized damage-inducible protein DinB
MIRGMRLAEMLIAEFQREQKATERVLERVPLNKLDWRPHPKSRSIGELAWHIATLPGFGVLGLQTGKRETTGARPPAPAGSDYVPTLRKSLEELAAALRAISDEALLKETFSFTRNGEAVLTLPKAGFIRTVIMNHWIHHRGQMSVYLRLLDVPVPVVYGTTADEDAFGGR